MPASGQKSQALVRRLLAKPALAFLAAGALSLLLHLDRDYRESVDRAVRQEIFAATWLAFFLLAHLVDALHTRWKDRSGEALEEGNDGE